MSQKRISWGTRTGFLMAAAGSAIGLGNIWKFSYIVGENGGGAFVLVYMLAVALVGLPVLISALYIGANAKRNVIDAFKVAGPNNRRFNWVGYLALFSAVIILSYYSVIGGWILDFSLLSIFDRFSGQTDAQISSLLNSIFQDPVRQIFWHFIFMGIIVVISLGGIKKGIERWSLILMPVLFVLLFGLIVYSVFLPGFFKAISFLFSFDTSKLSAEGILEALGHAFFTLSVGMGCMITYGSYLAKKEEIASISLKIVSLDTLMALSFSLVIFSAIFSFGIEPSVGPTLIFQTLPILFSKMYGGYFVAVTFFVLVAFAAITSAISVLEVIVTAWLEHSKRGRTEITIIASILIFGLGILSAFSSNLLSEVRIFGLSIFGFLDQCTSHISIPIVGIFISLFFGWILGRPAVQLLMGQGPMAGVLVNGLLIVTRFLVPAAVFMVFLNGMIGWLF